MSNYDFDQITDRRNTGSLKWDVAEGELPMWVADMDFQTAPAVREAIEKRAAHGVFGYTDVEEDWYQAYMDWWERRHQFSIKKEWLTFCTGVVPAISSTVRKLTTPGENVLIQTPVYNIFFNSIVNNGRNVVECPLAYDGEKYEMDFEALEEKLSDPQTSLMILCNPHNPVGRIWERETLARVGELCEKYHVTVLSDEIHCDITRPGTGYLPFAAASETCKNISVTCIAPTKAFNIAGIQTAAVMIPNKALHHKVWRALNTDEVAEPNVFAAIAPVVAFQQGGDWLDELKEYLWENRICPKVIMADVSRGSLDKARDNCAMLYPGEVFDLRLGSGLEVLEDSEVDTVVIAGMGGILMTLIMTDDINKTMSMGKYVLQPRISSGRLRHWLLSNGFSITGD